MLNYNKKSYVKFKKFEKKFDGVGNFFLNCLCKKTLKMDH